MANIDVNPNIPLRSHQPVDISAKSGSYLGNLLNTSYLIVRRPFDHVWYQISSTENPTRILKKIDEASERGLQRAKTRGVPLESVAPRLHGEIDRLLETESNADRTAAMRNRAQVGQVADIRPLLPDREVTRAPALQDRVDATNWKEVEIPNLQKKLSEKLSAFAALISMRDCCGKEDENNLRLMSLVKRATEGPNPSSIWELFTSNYQLSFFEKVQAAWFYWIYYKTSLISNTITTYIGSFIKTISEDLKKDNTRTSLIRGLLQNTNQFLVEDIQAAKDFSLGKEHGDLSDYQDRAIERHYNFSLPDLYKAFSKTRVEKDSPAVPFFRRFQEIPVLGSCFKGFERFINKFIIQRKMINSILPKALESAVNKGLEATQPQNLSFTLNVIRFFTKRLELLQEKLNDGIETPKPTTKFPGTELLSPTVKNLLQALALQGVGTPLELRKKFAEIERKKNWIDTIDTKVEEGIEDGIIKASDLLFRIVDETAESGELFAKLLELSVEPFSEEERDQDLLKAQYKEERSKLDRTARSVFKEITRQAVVEVINRGPKKENSQQIAATSFAAQKKITDKSVEELDAICTRMAVKVEQSRIAPTPENNVQTDIGSILQTLQVLASRKELQENLGDAVKGVDQDAIWRALTPLLTQAKEIQDHVLVLQTLQDHYPSHASVVTHLNQMQDLLKSIRDQFHTQPRHLQNPLIQSLRKTADEIAKCLGTESPPYRRLQGFIGKISQLSDSIVKEQQVIDAIQERLYPPRNNNEEDIPEGLLDQMLNYQRGVHPKGFKPHACLQEIGKCLAYFHARERIELERIIGNGSNLRAKWTELGEAMQRIYTGHLEQKNRDKARLDQELDTASTWIQEKTVKYNLIKTDDHNKMRVEMEAISTGAAALKKEAEKMQLNLAVSLSPETYKKFCTLLLPAVVGVGTSAVGLSAAVVGIVTAISSAVAKVVAVGAEVEDKEHTEGEKAFRWPSIGKQAVGLLAKCGLAYFATPYVAGVVGASATAAGYASEKAIENTALAATITTAGYIGLNGTKIAVSAGVDRVFDSVWGKYNAAYDLLLQPRIYKATTTRVMKALS